MDLSAPIPQHDARRLLLAAIAGCGREPASSFLELRFREPGAPMRQAFYACDDVAQVAARAAVLAQQHDTYAACAPRVRRFGGAEAVERVWMLWADLDGADALERLASFKPWPSIVVRSGSPACAHAWWVLNRPLTPAHARVALRRLAHTLGADMAAAEPARILRLPGTVNRKHDPPTRVQCTRLELSSFHAREIVGELPDPPERRPEPAAPTPHRPVDGPDALRTIAAEEYVLALTGREPGPDGKVTCPFHAGGQERTPSMHLYGTGWTCFGSCEPLHPGRDHAGGDIYVFAGLLYRLDWRDRYHFWEIRRRLARALLAHHREVAA
jgi:hypothetical protein